MWDERYQQEGFAYGVEANDFLKAEYSAIPSGGKVLCLCEGEGRNAVFLAKQGYKVTAVDLSPVGLEKAEKLAKENGVEIATEVANLQEYDLGDACWDGVVSVWAHLPESLRARVHQSVVRSLKPNGVVVLEAYTPKQLTMSGVGGPNNKEMLMDLSKLRTEFSPLSFSIGREVERYISEGQYHKGDSAVVQVVAKKA